MKKGILRVLGILFSISIVAGMFLPYIKDPASSLFELYKSNNQIVLPIVLLAFALASALLYILNRYIAFALSTGGAILFYMVTETVSLVKEDAIGEINIGFIIIGVGTILLIINTLLALLSSKKEPVVENTNNTYTEPVQEQPIVEPVQPVIQQPIVEPVQPVIPEPIVEPVQPVIQQPIVEPVQPVIQQPIVEPVQPVIQQPIVEPVQPVIQQPIVEPVQPVIQQPIVEPVQPVIPEPIVEPVQPVQPQPINELNPQGLKPIEEPVVVPTTQFNPLPDIQFEPIEEPVQEFKPINPEPKEAPLNPVLQQFEIPTSFLNSGAPAKSEEPQIITTPSEPSVGMDIFNNH